MGLRRTSHAVYDSQYSLGMGAEVSEMDFARLTDTLRDMKWIVGLIDARASKPNRPKTYAPRNSN